MKKILLVIAIFLVLNGNAQPYLISFAGTGASATVNTVNVENLTRGTTLTLNGSDILRLSAATGVNSVENRQSPDMKIYPNPTTGNSTMEIFPPVAGDAVISVYEMTGKPVAQVHSYLENYPQEFSLSGIKSGFYLVNVKGNNYQFSGKILCNGQANGTITINKIVNNQEVAKKISKTDNKGTQATVDMAYTAGDRLKFTGISGNYSTVMTDIPTSDKAVTFNLIACSDGDGNNYPVVGIGTQIWMAENLKTTRYSDGFDIPLQTNNTDWGALSTPAYCYYNNTASAYKDTYGALYNWYAVDTVVNGGKNVCPTGWHVPSDSAWTKLTTYLGGESLAGDKLKETGVIHWSITNAAVTNETGFTALPGGIRYYGGSFSYIKIMGYWWSSTDVYPTIYTRSRYMDYLKVGFYGDVYIKRGGLSVRCLKN
jgi:uncharacterized protein (TIGR02145 family)